MGLPIITTSKDVLIDQNGNIVYLMDNSLWSYAVSTGTDKKLAELTSIKTDLGEPSIDKLINFIDVDYVGAFTLTLADNAGLNHTFTLPNSTTRVTRWVDFPLEKRKPFQKVQLTISSATLGTIIYGIEIDFNILQRRRYN